MVKAHLGRITDDTPEHTGVVVFSMTDSPLVSLYIYMVVDSDVHIFTDDHFICFYRVLV